MDSPDQLPVFVNDETFAEFWETHAPSKAYLDLVGEAIDHGLPAARQKSKPVAIRFDSNTIARLKALAARRRKGYQTLLKEFVSERLYEEEKREGIIPP
ncbi:MAG: CopG family antitoxin [Tepidiformaceae bacterium]